MITSLGDTGMALEFWDEWSTDVVELYSRGGTAIRVLAYALEFALFLPLSRPISRADISVFGCRRGLRAEGRVEVVLGQPHRVLWPDGSIEPADLEPVLPGLEVDERLHDPDSFSNAWFDQWWPEQKKR